MTDPLTIVGAFGAPNLAIDVQPTDSGGVFIVDDSLLDDADVLAWGDDPNAVWVNIVCDVTRVHIRRGATRLQGPLTRAEAGEATIDVLDSARRFDPLLNADAIHAGTPLRVRVWGGGNPAAPEWSAVLFTATLDDLPVVYPKIGPPEVTLTATDVIAQLASWSSVGRDDPGVGEGDTLLDRVQRVLAETGSPATISPDSDAAYVATLAPTTLAGGWDDITAAMIAELGRVWVDSANRLVVRARESLPSGPVRGTLSDWHGEAPTEPHCCYGDLAAALGTEQMVNRVVAARRVPRPADDTTPPASAVVQLDDETSQAQYRRVKAAENRSLELSTDAQLGPWADSLLSTASRPELRVDSLAPAPWGAEDGAAWRAVCETDIGDRWLLRYHPEQGPTVLRTVGVLGIEHEISPEEWAIRWTTEDAPTTGDENLAGWFTLSLSELDGDDLLARFGGAVGMAPA